MSGRVLFAVGIGGESNFIKHSQRVLVKRNALQATQIFFKRSLDLSSEDFTSICQHVVCGTSKKNTACLLALLVCRSCCMSFTRIFRTSLTPWAASCLPQDMRLWYLWILTRIFSLDRLHRKSHESSSNEEQKTARTTDSAIYVYICYIDCRAKWKFPRTPLSQIFRLLSRSHRGWKFHIDIHIHI